MRRIGAGLLGVAMLASGCAYYNAIYNAEQAFDEGERLRRAGRDSAAVALYQDVIRHAADGYRQDPDGEWADEALFLVGRARLRLGESRAARAALIRAAEAAQTEEARQSILVYLAIAQADAGDMVSALRVVNESLGGLRGGPALADGHLLRGRILLANDNDAGWWDLDRAPEVEVGTRVEAAIERLRWAFANDQVDRAEEGFSRLLGYPEAGERVDTIVSLALAAADRWDAQVAADLLDRVSLTSWDQLARARIVLTRADLYLEAGNQELADRTARSVADGVGDGAAEARLRIAQWQLDEAARVQDLDGIEPLLLPVAGRPAAAAVLAALDEVRALAGLGLDEPLAWFAAAETARDELGAWMLARGFFVAYADANHDAPWVPKALLAAIDMSPGEGDRVWLRGRLEAFRDSPYVLAATGAAAPGFEALEEDLALRLSEVKRR